jgi:Tol biopolymer transport system component
MLNLADLLRVPQVDTGLRFDISPDGQTVAFSWNKTGNWEIYELSFHRKGAKNPKHEDCFQAATGAKFSPRYSPDGKHLTYALDLDGSESYHIILHNLGNDSHIDLTPDFCLRASAKFCLFLTNGKTLAILSDEQGQFAVYLLSVETGEKNYYWMSIAPSGM